MPSVIAVDVGGTSIKAARADESGTLTGRRVVATPVGAGPDAVVAAICDVAGGLADADAAAVGVVVPGLVDAESGTARYSTNLGWRDVPLRELLAAAVDVPVVVGQDVAAAGLAERTFGAARDVADCLVVVIGTGIASVPIVAGNPVIGASGSGGELGHTPVYPDGEACACGQRGCCETYASAAAIARRYRSRTGRALSTEQLAAALDSDPAARDVWWEAADALGLALASYTLVLDPALVVLAGGLAAAGATLRDPVRDALTRRLAWRAAPAVEVSPLAGDASLHGAALLARRALDRNG